MILKAESDWVVPVLNDVAAFLAANSMHDGAAAVMTAIEVVRNGCEKTVPPAPLVRAPIRDSNVIRFSVVSRDRT
jgi:hypothetical protein